MVKHFIEQNRYIVLILGTAVAGISQGLLLSLLAIILENQGVSSTWNSINALALYAGILLVNPFLEYPVRKLGYKPVMLLSLVLITIGTILFPVWGNLLFWMALRFLVGVGDSALHFATSTWIIATTEPEKRGQKISIYGFSYGIGFGIGPIGINLLSIHEWAPFIALTVLYLLVFGLILGLNNDYPHRTEQAEEKSDTAVSRYGKVILFGWFALIPTFLYGYMESSLNNNFPVFALREGITKEWVSILLPSFVIGSVLLQIPLGILSDRIGRRKILIGILLLGGIGFCIVPFITDHEWMMLILFTILGGLIGSTYSLGIAFAADILPNSLIPTFNIMAGMLFGIASMIGASINGILIEYWEGSYMFYLLSILYLGSSLLGFLFKLVQHKRDEAVTM